MFAGTWHELGSVARNGRDRTRTNMTGDRPLVLFVANPGFSVYVISEL